MRKNNFRVIWQLYTTYNGYEAKTNSKSLIVREDWKQIRLELMEKLLRKKFQDDILSDMLVNTPDVLITEINTWNDTFWGICRGKGEDNLGKLLRKIKAEKINNVKIMYSTDSIINASESIIINPVNTVGVMGAGLALQIKQSFPWSVADYVHACNHGKLEPGGLVVCHDATSRMTIIHLATKDDWRNKSDMNYIKTGLHNLRETVDRWNVAKNTQYSIAIPKLGCGLGGLNWNIVHIHIRKTFSNYVGNVQIYV